jgi:hypothetical protein
VCSHCSRIISGTDRQTDRQTCAVHCLSDIAVEPVTLKASSCPVYTPPLFARQMTLASGGQCAGMFSHESATGHTMHSVRFSQKPVGTKEPSHMS